MPSRNRSRFTGRKRECCLGITVDDVKAADSDAVPRVAEQAIPALRFSVRLPFGLAVRTVGKRLADPRGAREIARTRTVRYRAL